MKKVLVATEKPFAPIAIKGLREVVEAAGYQLELLEKYTAKEQLLQAVADADAIIIRSDIVDAEVIDAAKKLKLVVRAGAGYDNIDLAAATAHGICAMNTPGQNANAVAELAIGLMIYAQRNMYNGASGTELRGKNLGLHAYGNVARAVARIAEGMGMNIYVYDPYTSQEAVSANGHTKVDTVQELYSNCNIVSLHIPATPETKQSIGRDLVGSMPKGALLVNTARKEVINEPELLALMSERTDIKYFTDIAPAALEDFKNCQGRFFAPPKKMGAQTAEANINAGIAAARQIVAFFENGDERFRVNK